MAIRDFNLYLANVQAQVLATKNDLADFEQGLKDGHVTEQQVEDLKAEYQRMDDNYQRLLYVGYLLELPKSKWRKKRFRRKHDDLEIYLDKANATEDKIIKENEIAMELIKNEIAKLKTSSNNKNKSDKQITLLKSS